MHPYIPFGHPMSICSQVIALLKCVKQTHFWPLWSSKVGKVQPFSNLSMAFLRCIQMYTKLGHSRSNCSSYHIQSVENTYFDIQGTLVGPKLANFSQ